MSNSVLLACATHGVQNAVFSSRQQDGDSNNEKHGLMLFDLACLLKNATLNCSYMAAIPQTQVMKANAEKGPVDELVLSELVARMRAVWLTRLPGDEARDAGIHFACHYWFPYWKDPAFVASQVLPSNEEERICTQLPVSLPEVSDDSDDEDDMEEDEYDEEEDEEDEEDERDDTEARAEEDEEEARMAAASTVGVDMPTDADETLDPMSISKGDTLREDEQDHESENDDEQDGDDCGDPTSSSLITSAAQAIVLDSQYCQDRIFDWENHKLWNSIAIYTRHHWLRARTFDERNQIVNDLLLLCSMHLEEYGLSASGFDYRVDDMSLETELEEWMHFMFHTILLATDFGTLDVPLCDMYEKRARNEPAVSESDDSTVLTGEQMLELVNNMHRVLGLWVGNFAQIVAIMNVEGGVQNRRQCIETCLAFILTAPRTELRLTENDLWDWIVGYMDSFLVPYASKHNGDIGTDIYDADDPETLCQQSTLHWLAGLLTLLVQRMQLKQTLANTSVSNLVVGNDKISITTTSNEALDTPQMRLDQLNQHGMLVMRKACVDVLDPLQAVKALFGHDMVQVMKIAENENVTTPLPLVCHYLSHRAQSDVYGKYGACNKAGQQHREIVLALLTSTEPMHPIGVPVTLAERSAICKVCSVPHDDDDEQNTHSTIVCDLCERVFHNDCLLPPLLHLPAGEWHCCDCSSSRLPVYAALVASAETNATPLVVCVLRGSHLYSGFQDDAPHGLPLEILMRPSSQAHVWQQVTLHAGDCLVVNCKSIVRVQPGLSWTHFIADATRCILPVY